jgi:pimeloyl-ACP methyl ester carboxylesterase
MGVTAPTGANLPIESLRQGAVVEPVDLVAADGARSSGLLYQSTTGDNRVGVHLLHPRTDQTRNYNIPPLVAAGCTVLARSSRSVNNDSDTVHEELLLDVAAGVTRLRDIGCEYVVLLGNSGGAPLAAFYQATAETAAAARPAPDPSLTRVDLRAASLPPADVLVSVGGHLGEGITLARMIDAAVVDETDPLSTDPALDIYDPLNGFRLPLRDTSYEPAFVEVVRAAQLARVGRIDALARHALDAATDARAELADLRAPEDSTVRLRLERRAAGRRYLVVHRTIADPAFVDLAIEPDDRVVGFDAHPRPDLLNHRQAGFAHLLSPRAWLSTWSAISSHADMVACVAAVSVPTLFVHYAGDIFSRLADARRLADACSAGDSSLVVVRRADHYGREIRRDGTFGPRTTEGTRSVVDWLAPRVGVASSTKEWQ